MLPVIGIGRLGKFGNQCFWQVKAFAQVDNRLTFRRLGLLLHIYVLSADNLQALRWVNMFENLPDLFHLCRVALAEFCNNDAKNIKQKYHVHL